MGRHSLPDGYGRRTAAPRPRARRRKVAIATALVLSVATGTVAAIEGGALSLRPSCEDSAVRLRIANDKIVGIEAVGNSDVIRALDVEMIGQ